MDMVTFSGLGGGDDGNAKVIETAHGGVVGTSNETRTAPRPWFGNQHDSGRGVGAQHAFTVPLLRILVGMGVVYII